MKESSSAITRRKIVDVATDVFGRMGYQSATVRDIVRQAGVNQAAVNYHFRGKDALYAETIRQALEKTEFPALLGDKGDSPEQELRLFLEGIVDALHAEGPSGCKFARLIARELTEPSGLFEYPACHHDFAADVIRRFFPPETQGQRIRLATFWLLAQCAIIERARATVHGDSCKQEEPRQAVENTSLDFFLTLVLRGILHEKQPESKVL